MKFFLTRILPVCFLFISALAFSQSSLRIYRDVANGFPSYIRGAPSYIDARVLAANTNETITVPASVNAVIFSSSCAAFYAIIGPTAAVPAADVTDGSGSELNPASWFIGAATQIGIIAPATCVVTLSWYSVAP